jgi:hypothetical protein
VSVHHHRDDKEEDDLVVIRFIDAACDVDLRDGEEEGIIIFGDKSGVGVISPFSVKITLS